MKFSIILLTNNNGINSVESKIDFDLRLLMNQFHKSTSKKTISYKIFSRIKEY